jgi:preprotein translocase subunit SecD
MGFFPSREKEPGKLFDGSHLVLAYAVTTLIFLFGAGSQELLKAEERGDLILTLQVTSGQPVTVVMDTIRKRAAALGASKDDLVQRGSKSITVRLPGYKEEFNKAVRIMETRALLEFKLVDSKADVAAAEKGEIPPGDEILYKMGPNPKTGVIALTPYVTKKKNLMTGDLLTDARVQPDQTGRMTIEMEFNSIGAQELERITGGHLNERLAIILDGRVYSTPLIKDRISGGSAMIVGMFTHEEAEELALMLRCGPLAAPVKVVKSEWLKASSGTR